MEDKLQELLTITMEECGELIQACSKAIRTDQYHFNEKLIEEIGDVQCMIDLIHEYDSWKSVFIVSGGVGLIWLFLFLSKMKSITSLCLFKYLAELPAAVAE